MRVKPSADDHYAFLRERAAQLWNEREFDKARGLLREMDEEQLRRFEACRCHKEYAAGKSIQHA